MAAGTINLNGTVLTLRKPSGKDIGKWRAFIRQKVEELPSPIKEMREELRYLNSRDRREMLKIMHDNRMSRKSLTSPQAKEIMEGNESTAYLLYLCAKTNHPDVTYESALEMVESSDLKSVQEAMDALLGDDEKKDESKAADRNGEAMSLTG